MPYFSTYVKRVEEGVLPPPPLFTRKMNLDGVHYCRESSYRLIIVALPMYLIDIVGIRLKNLWHCEAVKSITIASKIFILIYIFILSEYC